MKIIIVGAGYVGLVSSACFAELGHSVDIIDVDEDKIKIINSGKSPIFEKDLDELLAKHIHKNLNTITNYEKIAYADIIFVCIGTPPCHDGKADLSMIENASKSIGKALHNNNKYQVIAIKSTVPPGSTENLITQKVLECSVKNPINIGFVMNPEFLREGMAITDFINPDRIVIGCQDEKAAYVAESAYQGIDAPIFRTNIRTAEMIKYVSNAFLATKISFSNEIGNICKKMNIDVYDVMQGVGMDHRIGMQFLNAGAGFGGSCFPKDIAALICLAEDLYENPILLKSVSMVNKQQPLRIVELLEKRIGDLQGKRISILGLAFKANTDDIRESQSIPLIFDLMRKGADVVAYDPKAMDMMRNLIPSIQYCENLEEALEMSDACVIMTEWDEFKQLNKEFDVMKSKVIIEGRKILSIDDAEGICW